jgi:hypothetical protein
VCFPDLDQLLGFADSSARKQTAVHRTATPAVDARRFADGPPAEGLGSDWLLVRNQGKK